MTFRRYAEKCLGLAPDASDLFLAPGRRPAMRLDGKLVFMGGLPFITSEESHQMATELLKHEGNGRPNIHTKELTVEAENARWRVSLFRSREQWRIAARKLNDKPPSLRKLGFSAREEKRIFGGINDGLIVVAGPTGSGKTTTCMAAVQTLLERKSMHVVTVEDPVEYLLNDGMGLASQREVGRDVPDFASALRDALRQDPDVIVLGETRDPDAAAAALQAAETGHLVFTTIHASSLEETVGRLVDVHSDPGLARRQVSSTLRTILVQRLIEKNEGGRRLVFEAVRGTEAVSHIIAEGREREMHNEAVMQGFSCIADQLET